MTGLSALWQYSVGTIEVSATLRTWLVAVIAGIVAIVVNYLTIIPYFMTIPEKSDRPYLSHSDQ
jgi:riboflavin transporter FmnP